MGIEMKGGQHSRCLGVHRGRMARSVVQGHAAM